MKTVKSSAPETSILNPKRKWESETNVQKTWAKFGWKPTKTKRLTKNKKPV